MSTVYMVIEEDRGLGMLGRRAFWSEEEAEEYAASSSHYEVAQAAIASTGEMTLDKAAELAQRTDYALDLDDCDGQNPVNWGDAAAFFLEGYLCAKHGENSRRRRNNGATEVYEMPDQATRPMWYVCELNRYNVPNWQNADGPHDSREECEETIALMNRLNCLQKKERVICEVRIYEGKEAPEGLNHDAINTLNTCVEAQQ